MRLPALFLLAALGCASDPPDPEGFGQATADIHCGQYRQCSPSEFKSDYSNREDCVTSMRTDLTPLMACLSKACDYDSAAATSCLAAFKSQPCEAYRAGEEVAECAGVFTSCLATCATEHTNDAHDKAAPSQ